MSFINRTLLKKLIEVKFLKDRTEVNRKGYRTLLKKFIKYTKFRSKFLKDRTEENRKRFASQPH